jgi:hypothetical protein
MRTRTTGAVILLSVLLAVVSACGGNAKGPVSREVSEIRRTSSPPPGEQEAEKKDGEAFRMLSTKMDEYQNLMEACERLTRTEENRTLRESCAMRLKALRQELFDLTDTLRVKPE